MGLKERLAEKNRTRVQWEEITLKQAGERVLLKGLTGGENMACLRMGSPGGNLAIDTYTILLIAHGAHDPDEKDPDGNPVRIWNPELMEDRRQVAALSTDDLLQMADGVKRLSGIGDEDAGKATPEETQPETSIIALPSISHAA